MPLAVHLSMRKFPCFGLPQVHSYYFFYFSDDLLDPLAGVNIKLLQ